MTKQEFLDGVSFYLPTQMKNKYSGMESYSYNKDGFIEKQIRGNKENKVLISDHHVSAVSVEDDSFGYAGCIMGQIVDGSYKYEDLVKVEDVEWDK